jgi:hypothetical protein
VNLITPNFWGKDTLAQQYIISFMVLMRYCDRLAYPTKFYTSAFKIVLLIEDDVDLDL